MPEKSSDNAYIAEWLSLDELMQHGPAWHELARRAIEPNPLYEPDFLGASLTYLNGSSNNQLLVIWSDAAKTKLAGLFPLHSRWWKNGFLWPVTSLYSSDYTIKTTPLIGPDNPALIWQSALAAIAARKNMPSQLCLPKFYTGGPCDQALRQAINQAGLQSVVLESFQRPVVACDKSYRDYSLQWSKKKRKNTGRAQRQMQGLGKLEFATVTSDDLQFNDALNGFLQIEASGWKGRQGTALACSEKTRAFAHAALGTAHKLPEVHFDQLWLDGKLIASNANLISQGTVICFKAGYDEEYARYSPGVVLDNHLLARTLDEGAYDRLDSYAGDDDYLAGVWLERQNVGMIMLSVNPGQSAAKLKLLKRGFDLYRQIKTTLRR